MPKLSGITHLQAVKAFEKAGFYIARLGKQIVTTNGLSIVTIPRHNPVNAVTMGGIMRESGFTIEELKKSL